MDQPDSFEPEKGPEYVYKVLAWVINLRETSRSVASYGMPWT